MNNLVKQFALIYFILVILQSTQSQSNSCLSSSLSIMGSNLHISSTRLLGSKDWVKLHGWNYNLHFGWMCCIVFVDEFHW